MSRLNAAVEASGLIRRAEVEGGFGTILHKGDPERGALLLVIAERGRHHACLERLLDLDGNYEWRRTGPDGGAESAEVARFLSGRTRFDADLWLIELDVAQPERFIAETTGLG